MLVLTRKNNETIVIKNGADTIRITVVRSQANKVRFALQAPDNYQIYREELLDDEAPRIDSA